MWYVFSGFRAGLERFKKEVGNRVSDGFELLVVSLVAFLQIVV